MTTPTHMKRIWWISVGLVLLVLLGILAAMSPLLRGKDHGKAMANLQGITGRDGIEILERRQWCGSRTVGGPLENWLRRLCRIDPREEPFQLAQFRFRDSAGDFSVQIWDSNGRVFDVIIHKPPTGVLAETDAALRESFPDATYE